MFEYVTLKNFKSFENITIDFRDRQKKAKPLILLLGPNGIGKSNIVSVFELLSDLFDTMNVRDFLESLLSRKDIDTKNQQFMMKYFHEQLKDIEDIIRENKMIGSTDNMYIEFGFSINEKSGTYIVETNDTQIVHERLSYILVKNKSLYFDITQDKININRKLFATKESYSTILESAKEYWGKHSIFSILMHEISDKTNEFMNEQLSENLRDVISALNNISCANHGYKKFFDSIIPSYSLKNLKNGEIDNSQLHTLQKTEHVLNQFFTTMFPNIKNVYYKTTTNESILEYTLYFKKQIGSQIRDIHYKLESDGIAALISLFPLLLNSLDGITSVIDEFDNGLHEILSQSLLNSLQKYITGQLILTTHNINLLDSDVLSEYVYIISEDDDYNKHVQCITETNQQIHANSNRMKQYLEGKYQGLPQKADINFDELRNYFRQN